LFELVQVGDVGDQAGRGGGLMGWIFLGIYTHQSIKSCFAPQNSWINRKAPAFSPQEQAEQIRRGIRVE